MKQLEVGKTLIANIPMRKNNSSEINDYPNLYFGNILEANNSKVPPAFYVQVLVRFLCGDNLNGAGLDYEVPDTIDCGKDVVIALKENGVIKDEVVINDKKIDLKPLKNRPSRENEEKATVTVVETTAEAPVVKEQEPEITDIQKKDDISEDEESKPTFAEIREQRKLEKQKKKEEQRQEKLRQQQIAEEEKQRKKEEQEKLKAEQEARRKAEEEKKKLEEEKRKAKEEAERLKKQKELEKVEEALDNTQEIPITSSSIIPKAYTIKMMTMVGITVASILVAVFAFLCLYGVIPNMNPALSSAEKKVIHLVSDVKAGEVITKDDVESVMITTEQYDEISGKNVIKADGTTMSDSIVLYDNISDVVGKFATDNLTAGDYLMVSDYSELAEGESVITMNIDGTETTIPINVTTAGKSSINLYAIVTTTLEDGTKKNLALNMGTFSLEGRTLEDVLNSDGKSVIGNLLNQTESSDDAKAEATATPEGE